MKFTNLRVEESGEGVVCDSCGQIQFVNPQMQFNGGYAWDMRGTWSNVTVTGGFSQGNGVSNSSGSRAHIALNGTSGAVGGLHFDNHTFLDTNFSQGGTTQYVLQGVTAGSNNPNITFSQGELCTQGYGTAFATYASGAPTVLTVDTSDCNLLRTGQTTLSVLGTGFVGIGTATPLNGLDVLANGIHIGSSVPSNTGAALYNVSGTLYWNGSSLGGGGISYPGAGVANSTGSAWGTSYTVSGTGTVLAATASPTFTGTVTEGSQTMTGTFTSSGNFVLPIRVVTASGAVTVSASTDYEVVVNKGTGAATTVNLPSSPATGQVFVIKDGKGDAATNNITVTPAAGNIDGSSTYVINTAYGAAAFIYNGTQWNQQ
jgi:hypothetical protein